MFKLIINSNGLLSACPTKKDFKELDYHTTGMILRNVNMSDDVRDQLWRDRDHAYIIGKSLPPRTDDPHKVYFEIVNGQLNAV